MVINMEEYKLTKELYQRGLHDFVVEEILNSVKTGKCISRRLYDVLVYKKIGKFCYYIPMENLVEKENIGELII
jgi:hypothetical protein